MGGLLLIPTERYGGFIIEWVLDRKCQLSNHEYDELFYDTSIMIDDQKIGGLIA